MGDLSRWCALVVVATLTIDFLPPQLCKETMRCLFIYAFKRKHE